MHTSTNHYNKKRHIKIERLALVIVLFLTFIIALVQLWYKFKAIELNAPAVVTFHEVEEEQAEEPMYQEYDTCTISYYCPCEICNGSNVGVNAYDEQLQEGMAASNYYPQGFEFYLNINGVYKKYVICDKMNTRYNDVKIIDIFVDVDHDTCQDMGILRNCVIYK